MPSSSSRSTSPEVAAMASRLLQLTEEQFRENFTENFHTVRSVAASALSQAQDTEEPVLPAPEPTSPASEAIPDRDDWVCPPSLVIRGFAWDRRGLEVHMADGSRRRYKAFPHKEWLRLASAPSVGDYWLKYMDTTYEMEEL